MGVNVCLFTKLSLLSPKAQRPLSWYFSRDMESNNMFLDSNQSNEESFMDRGGPKNFSLGHDVERNS